MAAKDELENTLRAHGQSNTAVRRDVFTALQDEEPLSMRELVSRCPQVNRASVYRTVALFVELGIAQRIQHGWKYKIELSDAFHHHHHHATCTQCGRSLVLSEDTATEKHLQRLAKQINFQLDSHQLELSGICDTCQTTPPNVL